MNPSLVWCNEAVLYCYSYYTKLFLSCFPILLPHGWLRQKHWIARHSSGQGGKKREKVEEREKVTAY